MAKLAFIGLGRMGFPMASHLAAHGHDVVVFNRNRARAEEWRNTHAGRIAGTIADAVKDADFVFSCVGDDPDIRAVALAAFPEMRKGAIFIDHTTGSASLAEELSKDAEGRGLSFIDAPVSGGEAGAQKGQLTVMCGGSEPAYAKAEPIIRCIDTIKTDTSHTILLSPGGRQLRQSVLQKAFQGQLCS